jgi:hypothetical protein
VTPPSDPRLPAGVPRPVRRWWSAGLALLVATGLGLGTASCGGGGASVASRVSAWVTSADFGGSVGALLEDSSQIQTVVRRNQGPGALRAWCGVLEDDASTAAGHLPSPVTNLTSQLQTAYRLELSAANLCYGDSTAPPLSSRLTTALRDMTSAEGLMEEALQEVAELDGRVPSTTPAPPSDGPTGGDPFA